MLRSTRAPFASVEGIGISAVAGLAIHRLTVGVALDLLERRMDPGDSDRALIATSLIAVDGDLLLQRGADSSLVGALRHGGPPLPLAQEARRRKAQLLLFLDLSGAQVAALRALPGDLALVLRLRGVCEHWENPLYDEDGYQKMRVGDSGLSRALQAIGATERLPLLAPELEIAWSEADRARELGAEV